MSRVALGLVLVRPQPGMPHLDALRQEPRLRIVFEAYGMRGMPAPDDAARKPTVVLADMALPPGVRPVMSAIWRRFPGAAIVMLDRKGDGRKAQRARNFGAAAVLTPRSRPDRFVKRVLAIGTRSFYDLKAHIPRLSHQLTPREWDILPYLARRFSAREIAADLTLSYATVRTHIRNIYAKCGVGSREQAARVAEALLADVETGYNMVKEGASGDELRRRHGSTDAEP